jgi:hypothetical protein
VSAADRRSQARAWARVARAAAHAHDPSHAGVEANRELFDAIEFAATDARLNLSDLVDAYAAGARDLDVSEVFDDVEEYLRRVASVQQTNLSVAFARVERALPDWRRQLALRICVHDSTLAAHRALGGQADRIEQARRAVADVLDGAHAADASDEEIDAYIRQLRVEQCDLLSVLSTAAWLAAQRARLAHQRDIALPQPAWATPEEIAEDRGAPLDLIEQLVDDALRRGLLTAPAPRRVVLTAAGRDYAQRATIS